MALTLRMACWIVCVLPFAIAPAHADEDEAQPRSPRWRPCMSRRRRWRRCGKFLTAYGTVGFSAEHLADHFGAVPGARRRVDVVTGQSVRKGDALARAAPTAAAALELQRVQNDAQFARKELARTRELVRPSIWRRIPISPLPSRPRTMRRRTGFRQRPLRRHRRAHAARRARRRGRGHRRTRRRSYRPRHGIRACRRHIRSAPGSCRRACRDRPSACR